VVAPGRGAHDCFEAASAHSGPALPGRPGRFSELNPQIARDVRQTALAGRLSCMTGTLKMLALSSAADEAAWAVLGPCGNRR
jgi:hypothetical protein